MKHAGCAIAVAAVMTLGSGATAAQKIEKPKVYVGGSAGLSVGSQRADFVAGSRRDATVAGDSYVSALGVFAGAEFKGLAGEIGYVKMGDQDIEITPNRTGSATETFAVARDVLFMTMSHELPWKVQKRIKLATAVKGGIARWTSESNEGDLSGWDLIVGLSATVKVNRRIDLRADALVLPASDKGQSDQQVMFLLGLTCDFEL